MFSMKCFQAAALGLAAIGMGFSAPDASAGSCSTRTSYHSGSRVTASFGGGSSRVSVSFGSGHHHHNRHVVRHRDYGHSGHYSHSRVSYVHSSHNHYGHSNYDRHVYNAPARSSTVCYTSSQPSGYWSSVYREPAYATRYDSCGRPYRVCVRAGYYERVWVSTGGQHY